MIRMNEDGGDCIVFREGRPRYEDVTSHSTSPFKIIHRSIFVKDTRNQPMKRDRAHPGFKIIYSVDCFCFSF